MKDIQVHLHYEKEDSSFEDIMKKTRETYVIAAKKNLDHSSLTLEEKKQLLIEIMDSTSAKITKTYSYNDEKFAKKVK